MNPDPLRPPGTDADPPTPRRTGCSVFGWLLAAIATIGLVAMTAAPPTVASRSELDVPPHVERGTGTLQIVSRPVESYPADRFAVPLGGVPSPVAAPAVMPEPGTIDTPAIGGVATWYDAPSERDAAAGPALRSLLGSHWRGSVVTVCTTTCITTTLTDWCACGSRHGKATLLDLDRRAFARLAPLSAGVVTVTVSPATLPATDTEGGQP